MSSIKIKKRENGLGLGGEEEIDAAGNKGWSSTVSSYNSVLDLLKETCSTGGSEKKKRKTTKSISVGMK